MRFELPYGAGMTYVDVPTGHQVDLLLPRTQEAVSVPDQEVRRALAEPIGAPRLRECLDPSDKVVIITSDISRPLPAYLVLPSVLEELWAAGVSPECVCIVFALGIHRRHTEAEKIALVGDDIFRMVKCIDSDPQDFVHLGETSLGTPVEITRVVAEADKRIALGNIEYHYFAGYSGGAKALMPGVSTRAAIQNNHSRMVLPEASAGRIIGNPVRTDLEEALQFCSLDYIVNVILDEHKQIIAAVAGDTIAAHRAGCAILDTIYYSPLARPADIVIASQGGAPKDANLYQTHKAMENARLAVKQGGIIITVGSCHEGFGEEVFAEWMLESLGQVSLVERISREFVLGGHKAAAMEMILREARIYLVSEMPREVVMQTFLTPFNSVQAALDNAISELGAQASVLIMPFASSTLPAIAR
ncbi:MAG: nickel-dependent lactate racemase [Symbiobacteriaceae bacterium]|nr:nickel-dependent lactate racemase [Symbiobacteriaceae bacterium]